MPRKRKQPKRESQEKDTDGREGDKDYKEALFDWDRNKRREEEKVRNIDANGMNLKHKTIITHKIPKDKTGKVTAKGKKTKGYKDWLEKRDAKRYHLLRQEYYDRKMTKADYQESVQ